MTTGAAPCRLDPAARMTSLRSQERRASGSETDAAASSQTVDDVLRLCQHGVRQLEQLVSLV